MCNLAVLLCSWNANQLSWQTAKGCEMQDASDVVFGSAQHQFGRKRLCVRKRGVVITEHCKIPKAKVKDTFGSRVPSLTQGFMLG